MHDDALRPLTLIIATKNRPDDFARLLRSIRAQPTQPERIVIIDQSEPPYAIEAAPDVEHVGDASLRGLTAARNAAIDRTGDADVLFLDDDAELTSDVVRFVREAYAAMPEVVGLQCLVTQPNSERPESLGARLWRRWEDVFYRGFFDNRLGPVVGGDGLARVHGCAMSFRGGLFAHERFDASLESYGYGEDWDFSRRAARHGALRLVRAATVTHHESPTNRYKQRRLLAQRWRNVGYFYDKYAAERSPLDRFWRLWWMLGETIIWLKKGYGLPTSRMPAEPE